VNSANANGYEVKRSVRGFTLIELLIAMVIFIIVAGAAFSLFNQHVQMATRQQNLSSVNIGLRNAMSQLEIDLSGAGQNLVSTDTQAPQAFTLGVIVHNNVVGVAATCSVSTANWSYPISSACFDSFTTINLKPCTAAGGSSAPILQMHDPLGASELLNGGTIIYGDDPANPGNSTTLTNDSGCFKNGDEILVVQVPTTADSQITCDGGKFNYCMGVVTLTADSSISVQSGYDYIKLPHNSPSSAHDPLGVVYRSGGGTNFTDSLTINTAYSSGTGTYVMDLGTAANNNAITYAVQANPSNSTDPQLMRCLGATCTTSNQQLLSDQVIGFKVGAALWNAKQTGTADIGSYLYDSSHYCSDAIIASVGPPATYVDCTQNPPSVYDPYDYTLVRSIRVSMISRTPPALDPTLSIFKNGFDNGPYLVQQASVVVDLRNLSNTDTTN
jgi:prepilin-type N-terminal cleavage/methylation domain-containing protein